MEELERLGDQSATTGRVILAHLGTGASLAAVRDGKCIDTSMSFTPTSGLPMLNTKSGLLGVSETSSDVTDLFEVKSDDVGRPKRWRCFATE